uniref:Lipoprotein n=1 Tax=candidate division WOR-3 bacterium TaxID=2052148 RepID=A0A7C4YG83_UNCW3
MKKFLLFIAVLIIVSGCSKTKEPPEISTHPTSLKKMEGPKQSASKDSLSYIISMIGVINDFAEGSYNFAGSLDSLAKDMGDYKYADGTWTWEVGYYGYTYKLTCTERSNGYEWKFYLNNVLLYSGFTEKDGSYAYWKWYYGGSVVCSYEWEDNGNGGYIKFYNGDLNSTAFFYIEWTTTSSYCEVTIHATDGSYQYEYVIREYTDHHGYAQIKDNGIVIFSVNWDTNGNITK